MFNGTMCDRVRIFWTAFFSSSLWRFVAAAQDVTLDSDTLSGLPIRSHWSRGDGRSHCGYRCGARGGPAHDLHRVVERRGLEVGGQRDDL